MAPTILDGTRLFARIAALDFECPRCGRITVIRPHRRVPGWEPRSGIYTCPDCQQAIMFGVLMYSVAAGSPPKTRQIPDDWIPTPRQSLALRQLQTGIHLSDRNRRGRQPYPRNARGPGCLCAIDQPSPTAQPGEFRAVSHPACPIHVGPRPGGGLPVPTRVPTNAPKIYPGGHADEAGDEGRGVITGGGRDPSNTTS